MARPLLADPLSFRLVHGDLVVAEEGSLGITYDYIDNLEDFKALQVDGNLTRIGQLLVFIAEIIDYDLIILRVRSNHPFSLPNSNSSPGQWIHERIIW